MTPNSRNRSPEALHRARRLRREMSISERVLWESLRKERLGFLFKRQVPVGPYVLDFYCPEARLCVEVDGEQHGERKDRVARDEWLGRCGIVTLRIPSLDLFEPTSLVAQGWLRRIGEICEGRAGRKAFPD